MARSKRETPGRGEIQCGYSDPWLTAYLRDDRCEHCGKSRKHWRATRLLDLAVTTCSPACQRAQERFEREAAAS